MLLESSAVSAWDRRWVVVNTHPNREPYAIEHLVRQEFEPYCPFIQKRIKHARKSYDARRPMFPGYVFVRIERDLQRWRPIMSTFGVRSLVRCGNQLSFLDDGFIVSLRAREVNGAIAKPVNPFSVGQQVQMAGGAFDGLVASIIEMDDKGRLGVLMNMLNGQVKVKVEARHVVAVG